MDLIERGIVAAVDIWSWVPSGVEVCFRAMGAAMVFIGRGVFAADAYALGVHRARRAFLRHDR